MSRGFCSLFVGVIGINFKTADLVLREAIARGAQSLGEERALFFRHPTVLLSTCNRTEIYFSAENLAEAHSDLLALLRRQINLPFEHRLYSYFGIECFAHLARVTGGLDSAILAETEIQRQVRVAYGKSASLFALPSSLHYLFQKSLKLSKTVRSQFALEKGAPTLYGTLWQIGERILGEIKGKKILLVGYSEINRGFARFLEKKKVGGIALCTRNPESVRMEGISLYDRKVLENWHAFDWIVTASQADDYLIRTGNENSQLILDLSVPRNVDPKMKCALYNIEQINQMMEEKKSEHSAYLAKCNAFVWNNVLTLSRIYQKKSLKTLHVLDSAGME